MSDVLNRLFGLGTGAAGIAGIDYAKEKFQDLGGKTGYGYETPQGDLKGAYDIGDIASAASQFKPFTVTSSGLGTVTGTPEGGLTLALSDEQQALQDSLGTDAQTFFDRGMLNLDDRQAALYETIRAAQRPEEERARMELQEQLANQGRLGVRTSMFGGTPEQLAMEQAIQESKNQAAVDAITQARADQLQQANLGSMYMKNMQLPQAGLLTMLSPAVNLKNIAQTGQLQGAEYMADAQMTPLETELAARQAIANLIGSVSAGLLGGATSSAFGNDGWLNL